MSRSPSGYSCTERYGTAPGPPRLGLGAGRSGGRDDDPSGSFRGSWGRECAPWHPASSRVSRDEREKSAAWPQKYQLGEGEMTRRGGGMSWGGSEGPGNLGAGTCFELGPVGILGALTSSCFSLLGRRWGASLGR